ncbi:hypothetical protein SAMN05421504_101268 [Amycolatopsis xylanica]|uniref:Uncharacterized protein n=1 Tax=Amycolatopsis xylanica TaxID=589385 RepID=A0A1H2SM30_9PSEU|nr:hypothetical protein SAMN05421504_101268 [Amycolatopsis xylanica]
MVTPLRLTEQRYHSLTPAVFTRRYPGLGRTVGYQGGVNVDVVVSADGPDSADQLRSLHEWLRDVGELRGRIGLSERAAEPGTLGPVLEALVVALGPAGAATAVSTAVISWLRTRRGEVRIKATFGENRSVELTATNVAKLDAAALEHQVARIAAMLEQGSKPLDDR